LTTHIDSLSFISNTDKEHQQSQDVENKCLIHSPIQATIDNIKTDDGSSSSNTLLQQLRETFATELAQTQKVIEDQRQLLLQQQIHIEELTNEKFHQQHHGLASHSAVYNNYNINSNSPLSSMEPQPLQKSLGNNSFKYDNFIEQQLIKEKINNIRKYSGNKYDDVDEWLQNIQQDFSSTLVSDEIRLKLIPKSLTNDAKSWFEQNKHRLLSWQTFTVEIQNRFQSSLHTDQKFIRLRERTQQPKET
ncbi:unnamed protein product, partial [Rotaria magnacalcarata]